MFTVLTYAAYFIDSLRPFKTTRNIGGVNIILLLSVVAIGGIYYLNSTAHADSIITTTQMSDNAATYGLSAYSGRPVQSEYVSSSSTLVSKSIDTIAVQLRKGGSPTGTVQVGVFNSDLSVKQLFGTIDPSTLQSSSYVSYTFSLTAPQTYQIQSGDRIGIKYTGGSSSSFAAIMTDQSNTFDGTKSYLNYYSNKAWSSYTSADITMALTLHTVTTTTAPPTVSASPVGGIYSSAQSVTLTASRASTIYYTKDGTTPTTSSPNGPSPVSGISITGNSTLKYFAKDSSGSTGSVASQTYTIITQITTKTDKFGITKLYPTLTNGREWFANWFTPAHTIISGEYDPYDSQLKARGDGYTHVNGDGTAYMSGSAPRMYVQDPALKKLWNNVEITFYGKRVSDTTIESYQGLTAGIGGSHDDVQYPNVCTDSIGYPNTAYNGRILYDGRVDYEKEVLYHRGDATSYGSGTYPSIKSAFQNLSTPIYSSSGFHSMPYNTWIGYKFIVQDTSKGVHMETWMDTTGGLNGGTWVKMNSFDDNGGWSVFYWYDTYGPSNWPCGNVPLDYVMKHAMPYVFIRGDSVNEVDYKSFSIREINPLP